MLKRLSSRSKSEKAAWGLVGLALSCGLCSRLGSVDPRSGDSPTATAVAASPTAAEVDDTVVPDPTATPQATATNEPSATLEPTAEPPTQAPPTSVPPTAVPPTEAPAPVEPTALPPPPTEAGPPRPDVNPDGDRDCKDFASRREAQEWWDYWRARGYDNPGRLDGGKRNGIVCERY